MKAQSPQLGYNHNIPHRGRLYHVQTEDSGIDKAHIFTHVFYDGTIIASRKTEYRDRLSEPELSPLVIGLMQDSHKSIIRSLRNGEFDDKIERTIGPHPVEDNRELTELPADNAVQRPERREPPEPRDVEPQGPPLTPGRPGPTVDPGLTHPVFAAAEARAQVAAAAAGHGQSRPSPGPSRIKRRAVGGIGGAGVKVGTPITQRRDLIVGKFSSEHQAQLDEEILALLRDEV
ncbi:MAG: hypothetical protein IAG13_04870 [Deltaproteobacteria bacterium]|nr:hypothetical protein [Nannocystaceae bacterium]